MLRLFLFLFFLTSAVTPVWAQTPAASPAKQPVKTALKDGAFRRKGTMMRIQGGKVTPLTAPLKLANGTTVYTDGRIVSKNGTQRLTNGRAINMQGDVVGFNDDMLSAATIQQLDEQVTGYKGTTVVMPNALSAETLKALARVERKATLVQQLTEKLAERAAQAVPVSEEATRINAELNTLDKQLQ
ncbi:hypothetical protein HER32_13085 [Hymenobacter sp. BT18]|uniref:DUF6799 domain-containing protein n=1 Tax=Hymenobacter sp. BT18 TaxID=2835648 RepID=UPI00143E9C81|nr:DUF6799 domain-containing protein [Hymenobacter sp. BT18]QIX62069.1 hypothetical protein HER32_13085 [Hymenobacter sp. BT18]